MSSRRAQGSGSGPGSSGVPPPPPLSLGPRPPQPPAARGGEEEPAAAVRTPALSPPPLATHRSTWRPRHRGSRWGRRDWAGRETRVAPTSAVMPLRRHRGRCRGNGGRRRAAPSRLTWAEEGGGGLGERGRGHGRLLPSRPALGTRPARPNGRSSRQPPRRPDWPAREGAGQRLWGVGGGVVYFSDWPGEVAVGRLRSLARERFQRAPAGRRHGSRRVPG